jgi:hypothetical protein
MRTAFFLLLFLNLAAPAQAQKRPLGIFFGWGAFEENDRCFAIAEPARSPRAREWNPFASIGYWPERGVRGQLHIRLSRQKREGSAVLLKIDERTWQLVGGGNNAWAPDARTDAEIAAAMRTGVDMSVETRSDRGALVRDYYRLRGAATAIDAAAIACTGGR